MMPIVSNVMNIGYALTAIVGGLFAFGGMLDLGGLAIYLQFGRQISQPMSQVSQQMTSLLSALAGAERIFEIIDMEPEVDEGKVTLVRAQKDENGAISENTGSERYHTWAWKVPRSSRLTLVPVMIEPDGSPVELGQAVHEDGALKMLPPTSIPRRASGSAPKRTAPSQRSRTSPPSPPTPGPGNTPTARAAAPCTSSAAASGTSPARTSASPSSRARCA